jgi:outer membrane receptor protein involved in Fe transport
LREFINLRSALICSSTIAAFVGSPSNADEVSDGSSDLSAFDSPYLDEIIVTATRRKTPVSEVPLSVHVKSAEELRQLNAYDFHDYARTVPSLSFVDSLAGGPTPVIRGVQTHTLLESTPTTAIYLGEVPITAVPNPLTVHYAPDPGLVDIERIEVLRGPQGTLFGSSALGGAMRIFPAEPDPDGVAAFWEAGVENVTDGDIGYRLSGMFNSPVLNDRGAVRGVAYLREVGGYVDNIHTGVDDVNNRSTRGVRLSAMYQLNDRWDITGLVMQQSTEWDGNTIENVPSQPRIQDQLFGPGSDDLSLYGLRVDGTFGWGTIRSVTSWYERDVDARYDFRDIVALFLSFEPGLDPVPENFTVNHDQTDTTQFVQELRFVSNEEGRFNWVAGAFYQDVELNPDQDFPSPGFDAATGGLAAAAGFPDNLTVFRGTYPLDQFALYGEGTYALTDKLDLAIGLRQFWIKRSETSVGIGWLFPSDPEDVSADESGLTPSVSLGFRPNERTRIYARAAEGFRPGGTNPQSFFESGACQDDLAELGLDEAPVGYDSDSLWSYELGLYASSRNGRYRFSGAVYHLDWSGMQSVKELDCGNRFIENAGDATVNGTELEVTAQPLDDLIISAGLAYRRSELAEDAPNFGASKGDRIPGVPEFTANLTAQWYFRRSGNWESYLQAAYNYVGNSFTEFNPDSGFEIPSYSMTRLAIGMASDVWSVDLFVNNLFDERGITNIVDALGDPWVITSRPRTVGVVVRWQM